ncbi:MAG: coproporphyrinogen III oxidase, partial [Actinomycetaceae bacterium]|nr:coproporphyrinogen III oxidase [Actinomycetaceae bacterium]
MPFSLSPAAPEIKTFSAYIHVPFCRARCGYCDFNTYTQLNFRHGASIAQYPDMLAREIEMSSHYMSLRYNVAHQAQPPLVETVFFGGGTPTMLPVDSIGAIYEKLSRTFPIAHDVEVTIEANPETVTRT